ncbi:MAG: cytochrome C oxidase subunit IV family protein [Chitinophagaceae bacterium]|nr:cytochrome C oxidase subunit IV family protein [Chitinophagaceae bacterium]
MENVEVTTNAHHGEEKGSFDTKAIWRTFWILLGITCIELVIGMFIAPRFPHDMKIWFNILYIIFTAAKAFYIIAEFMHLRHEIKNMIMTIAVPAMLFLWFIGAFLWEGASFKNLKNTYDPAYKERSTTPVKQQPAHDEHDTQKSRELH